MHMYICTYIHIYMYVYSYVCVFFSVSHMLTACCTPTKQVLYASKKLIYIYTYTYICVYMYVYVYTYTYAYSYIYIFIYIYIYIYTYIYIYICTCIYKYVHIYTYICMCIHMYVCFIRGSVAENPANVSAECIKIISASALYFYKKILISLPKEPYISAKESYIPAYNRRVRDRITSARASR